jgi:hypothetical protein
MSSRDRQVGGDHYLNMGVQPWDAARAWTTLDEYRGYLRISAIAYLARAGHKGLAEDDYRKAAHYLEALLETYAAADVEAPGLGSVALDAVRAFKDKVLEK